MDTVRARPVPRRTAVLTVALLVLGTALGWLGARGASPTPPAGPESGRRAPAASPREPGPSPDPEVLLRDLREGVELDPEPPGDGTIRGTVTTEDGRPLAGATVRAVPEIETPPLPPGIAAPAGDPSGPWTGNEVRRELLVRRGTREAITAADGSFLLEGIGGLSYRVEGFREGWIVRRRERGDVVAGDVVALVGRPVVLLTVDVRAPDGRPAAWARVNARGVWGERNRTWTPEYARIELPPGPVRLRAFAGDLDVLTSEEVDLRLTEGETPAAVVLRLRERTGIRVSLTFPPLAVRANLPYDVVALRIREGATPDPRRLLSGFHREARAPRWSPPRGTGEFVLVDMKPGTWLVGARREGRTIPASAVVRVEEGAMATVSLSVPFPETAEILAVRVLAPDGRAPKEYGLRLEARLEVADGTVESVRSEIAHGGTFRVYLPDAGKDGRLRLTVHSDEYGRRTVEAARRPGEMTVRLDVPATLTLVHPGYAGSRYEGVTTLTAHPASRPRSYAQARRPDPRGRTVFGPLAPGDWIVRVSVDRPDGGRVQVLEIPVRLASGSHEETLRPPPLCRLRVVGLTPGASCRLEPADGASWASGRAGPRGDVVFDVLRRGDYLLRRFEGRAWTGMPVHVAGDRIVTFRASALDALRVTILDPRGRLTSAGLADGDLVIEIAGERIEDARQAWALRTLREGEGPVSLTVLRGGSRLVVPLDLGSVRHSKEAGGTLRPWAR